MPRESKLLTALSALLTALLCLCAAVAVPILCRGWYYHEAEVLGLSEATGYGQETIHAAYDEVMDYLVFGKPFGTGTLRWTENGRAHFADCQALFRLNFVLLAVSGLALLLFGVLRLTGRLRVRRAGPFGPAVWALLGTAVLFFLLGVWAVVDFESLFAAFHALCFPGKTNWIFNWWEDEIILILPERFWADTAALVGALTLAGEALAALGGCLWRIIKTPKTVYEAAKRSTSTDRT